MPGQFLVINSEIWGNHSNSICHSDWPTNPQIANISPRYCVVVFLSEVLSDQTSKWLLKHTDKVKCLFTWLVFIQLMFQWPDLVRIWGSERPLYCTTLITYRGPFVILSILQLNCVLSKILFYWGFWSLLYTWSCLTSTVVIASSTFELKQFSAASWHWFSLNRPHWADSVIGSVCVFGLSGPRGAKEVPGEQIILPLFLGLSLALRSLIAPPLSKLYRTYYPHRSRDSVSPVCGIFFATARLT